MSDDIDPADEPLLDTGKFEDLRSILGDGEEGVDGLVDTFVAGTPAVLDELEAAVDAGDVEEVGRLAHKIKGEASTLGAKRLSILAKSVEDAAREEALEDPEAAAQQLRQTFEATRTAFEDR